MLLIHEINDGNIQAVHMLAAMLITGKFFNKNIRLAVEVLEKGVELKDPKSSFMLGKYHSDGNHVVPDPKKARAFFCWQKTMGTRPPLLK